MNLKEVNWNYFAIKDIFDNFMNGKANQGLLEEGDTCFYVGAKRDNCGVMFHCDRNEELVTKGNCVVFICNGEGSVGYAFYIDKDFMGTTDIVAAYSPHINEYTGNFIATIACKERFKYSHGRKWKTHLKNTKILLPIDDNNDINWKFMEEYIKSLYHKKITTKNKIDYKKIDTSEWLNFSLNSIFDISKAHAYNKETLPPTEEKDNLINCITRTADNNGCDYKSNLTEDLLIEKGNALTIGGEGVICFYQKDDFVCGTNMTVLRNNNLNTYNGLFIATVINYFSNGRFNYGRAFNKTQIMNSVIKLPAINNEPDWKFMENYIKQMPYGDRII